MSRRRTSRIDSLTTVCEEEGCMRPAAYRCSDHKGFMWCCDQHASLYYPFNHQRVESR